MYRTTFWADFLDTTVKGWTDGSLWNGWATPRFEMAEAQQIVDLFNRQNGAGKAYYDPETDQFCFRHEDEDEECFRGVTIEAEAQMVHLYPIGAWVWIWEYAEGASDGA